MKRVLSAVAFGVLLLAATGWANQETIHGSVESVDRQGRMVVDGQTVQVVPGTVIMTPNHVRVKVSELVPGVEVTVEAIDGSRGTEAVSITAYLLQ